MSPPPGRREVYRRTLVGAVAFMVREVVAFPVGLLVSILLARLLSPADFGVFATATFVLASLSGMLDLGVGLVVERRTEDPTEAEIRTIFTSRLLCFAVMFGLLWLAAPLFARFFRLGPEAEFFIRLVAISLFLTPVARTSRNLLNRRLQYRTLATIEVAQSTAYQGIALFLAWQGYGLQGLGFAYLAAIACDAALAYRAAGWSIRPALDLRFLRTAVGYGGLVQLSSMTYLLRDNIGVLLAGPLFGPGTVGYLNWAHRIVRQLTNAVTSSLNRLSFSSLARLQHDRVGMSKFLTTVVRSSNLMTLPLLASVCAVAPEIAHLVYTDKWSPGVPALYLFAACLAAGNITTTVDSLLKAVGRAADSLAAMSMWTALDWLLAILAVSLLGFTGVAVAYAVGAWIAAIGLLRRAARHCDFDLAHCVLRPLAAAAAAGAAVILVKGHWVSSIPRLVVAGAAVVLLSWGILLLWERALLLRELKAHWLFAREAFGSRP